MTELLVERSEVDGWDVIQGNQAVSNHPSKELALEAAKLRAAEEDEPAEVVVDEEHTHPVDETSRGMRAYFLIVLGVLAAVIAIIVITSLLASATGT
jgi:hypothetical protein